MRHLDLFLGQARNLWLAGLVLLLTQPVVFGAQQQMAPTITVTVNKSMVFRLADRAKRVSVSQPAVADVLVVAPSQLLINGKAVGTTSLIVFNEKGEVANYDLVVTPDVAALRAQLSSVFPNEKIAVSTSATAIVLKGEVSNEVVYDKVLEIVGTYLPPKPPAAVAPSTTTSVRIGGVNQPTITGIQFAGGGQLAFHDEGSLVAVDRFADKANMSGVIDLLVIKEVRQIELDVIVAEIALSKLREIGLDFLINQGKVSWASLVGSNSSLGGNHFSSGGAVGDLVFGAATSGIARYTNGATAITALYRAIQNKDITEILAQPRLVMKNGRSGGFMAGGEIPVVVTTTDDVNVQFKPFGVRLEFVPTLTWSDRIDLRVIPEVSEPDPALGSFTAALSVPAFKTRRTVSRVEMAEGETLIIGGLLDRRILKDLTKVPLLGDIPILGALFRSTRFQNRETELVFVITPRIIRTMKPGEKPQLPSIEKYDDPDIRQVPLPGSSEPRRKSTPGATIP
jgi:pilus assembly protein CpaC